METPSFEDIMRQIKINFRLTGMPFDDPKYSPKFFLPVLIVTVVAFEEMAFFYSKISMENFLELTQLAPCTAIGILSLLKIILIFYKKNKVFKLTRCLESLYNSLLNEPNFIHVKNDIIFTKTLIKYYFILNVMLISIYNFSSLFFMLYELAVQSKVQFHLPYSVLLPFPVNTWVNWLAVYCQLVIGGFLCALFFSTVDALYFILTSQVCINFTVLSSQLESFKNDQSDTLKELVKKHQTILSLTDDLEDIFTGPNFYNVLVGSLLICALGFNLTTGDWAQIPGSILFLSSVLLQLLMMSVFGENLSRESEKIGTSVYLCKWYEMDIQTRKTIMIIRERALRKQKLTAYKFSVISYGSFGKIIKASWSYFTILRTFYSSE